MSKKIVSISFSKESVEFLETEKTQTGYITFSPSIATTNESLQAACKRADEIYVNGLLPETHYGWEVFPKVRDRYLESLVLNFVKRKKSSTSLLARFQPVKEVVKDGTVSSLVAFQAVERENVDSLLGRINKFKHKVKQVHSLPASLAAALVESEKPSANFLLLWVRRDVTIISINSPEGLVKIARTLSYGLQDETLSDLSDTAIADFSKELSREIVMTINYFKQSFREAQPADLYVLGDSRLEQLFEKYPLEKLVVESHYGLTGKMPETMDRKKFNENIHLLGNLKIDNRFNFLPQDEITNRQTNSILNVSLAILALLIGLTLVWSILLPAPVDYLSQKNQVFELQTEVDELHALINKLQPVIEQKEFYKSAFLDEKPAFITILQQLASIMPQKMVFQSFKMTPSGDYWDCTITGKIKGQDWQERLDVLREFGRSLYSFANVDIRNVIHSLGQTGMDTSTINFQINMQFFPGEQK
jgi:hypothetical protein